MAFIGCFALMRAYPVIDVMCVNEKPSCSKILIERIFSYISNRSDVPAWLQAIGAVVIVGVTYFNWRNDRNERQRVESSDKKLRDFSVSVKVQEKAQNFLDIRWLRTNLEFCLFNEKNDNLLKFFKAASLINRVSLPAAGLMSDLAREVGENPYLLYTSLVDLKREVEIGQVAAARIEVLRDLLITVEGHASPVREHMNEKLQVVISRMQDAWKRLAVGADGLLRVLDHVPERPPEANHG